MRPVVVAVVRKCWDRLTLYIPVVLMGLLALGTYWLLHNTPAVQPVRPTRQPTHEADYYMRGFSVKTFDAAGKLKSELFGAQARHYPDTDTLEIDKVRIRSISPSGLATVATADRALTNGDASEVQLFGNAVVMREAAADQVVPRLEFRSEFLHAFVDTGRLRTHMPVVLLRGADRFSADAMDYDNVEREIDLRGRVRGMLSQRFAH